ncbi:MAG: TonB-dependent receptor [Winogradskyella sp.]|uniref:TonB-dependent receptor domain-containing protein n=1 Tax=Winogradskyella sp. TaxID=1883156 RepID=UPI0017F372B1|nr:TonB-dependent receptor [Winogradskyella sp.]MBT8245496.1 TonB-dependent receptor [Winogradskyella sp.]NNK23881.1 TonB-dependent receptor [Winogradskyella sp.]
MYITNNLKIITSKNLLSIVFCWFFLSAYSQIKGKVIDINSGVGLYGVKITSDSEDTTFSDQLGHFEVKDLGIYTFSRIGYQETLQILNTNEFTIIQLQPKLSELNEVIIDANHIPKSLKKSVVTSTLISEKDIQLGNDINISQVLNRAPGLFMQSGALNTNRLTIRGIGSRNLFGTSKIRAYFKDIPLTDGSGATNIEDFELNAIAQIKVTKGATSSVYGAGLGGTIQLNPTNSYLHKTSINTELTVGSFDLYKSTINFNHGTSKHSFRGIYSNTSSDGFRDNNNYNRQTFTITSNHFIDDKDELTFLGSYVDLKAFIPSSINQEVFSNNPSAAAFTWRQAQGFEDSQRGIFGATWDHIYNPKLKQITSIFTSFRNGYEPRPFNILDESTFAYGFRSRLLGNTDLFKKPLTYTIGGEYFKDNYQSQTFENLYQDFSAGTGSVQGNELSNFKEDRNYFNLFFELNFELSDKTSLVAGLNYNETSYELDDNLPVSDNNIDQSGSFKFDGIFSPKLGISHLLTEKISLYSNISQGFSPISLEETLLPSGQINNNLKPETGWNYEVGTRGIVFNNKLQFNLAIYRLDVRNLLVARRTAEDQFIGINAGQTLHDGLELSLNSSIIDKENFKLSSFFNYSLNNYKFEDFIDGENDFSDNNLTGIPSSIINAGIDFSTKLGFYGNINFQYVGEQPITDSNSLFSKSYSLTNIKIGYKKVFKKIKLHLFYGLDNIFDEAYASQILINATGFGGSVPRYFYPGNPINYYAGLNINYVF